MANNNLPQSAQTAGLTDLNTPIIYSHSGFVTAANIAALKAQNNYISITPQSEMHFGHGQASTLTNLSDIHAHAALGADTSKTFSHDLLLEACLWLHRVRSQKYEALLADGTIPKTTPMTVQQAFLLATRNGGRALRRGNDVGVLRVGAVADVMCFDGASPNMLGWQDAVAALVLHATVADVRHVMVNGQFRKRDGELVLRNEGEGWHEVKAKFLEAAKRVHEIYSQPMELGDDPFEALAKMGSK